MHRFFILFSLLPISTGAQTADSLHGTLTLNQCVRFALLARPSVRQAQLDREIAEKDIGIRLADWYPQFVIGDNFSHTFKKPVQIFPNITGNSSGPQFISTGVNNTNTVAASFTQTIFSNSLRIAASTARYYRQQAEENSKVVRENTVVSVSKAFYDLLLTRQQLAVFDQDIARLIVSSKEAQAQYKAGVNDLIDYQQSLIALNNARSRRSSAVQSYSGKQAFLKEQMGYPGSRPLELRYDSLSLVAEINVDTNQSVTPSKRSEFQVLKAISGLQKENYLFYKYGYLPTVSAFANYNLVNQNDDFAKLLNRDFPNAAAGLTFSIPLFQGGKRIQNLRRAALEVKRSQLDEEALGNSVQTEYARALGAYKAYLNTYLLTAENAAIAARVYKIVSLQYQQGIKPYLNLIQAESDLRTSQLTYLDALFQLLSSKLDVQHALGTVNLQP